MSDVTSILSRIEQGDPQAAEKLLPLVYEELRKLAAAEAMRRILVENARRRKSSKRGGDHRRVSLPEAIAPAADEPFDLLALERPGHAAGRPTDSQSNRLWRRQGDGAAAHRQDAVHRIRPVCVHGLNLSKTAESNK
jgi:hypothetical protein